MSDRNPNFGDTSVKYDDYPITEEGVERTDVEWLGFMGGSEGGQPQLYEPHNETVYEGEIDEVNERISLKPETGEHVSLDSLGEYLEDVGDDHGWDWLSSFAKSHLESDEE